MKEKPKSLCPLYCGGEDVLHKETHGDEVDLLRKSCSGFLPFLPTLSGFSLNCKVRAEKKNQHELFFTFRIGKILHNYS